MFDADSTILKLTQVGPKLQADPDVHTVSRSVSLWFRMTSTDGNVLHLWKRIDDSRKDMDECIIDRWVVFLFLALFFSFLAPVGCVSEMTTLKLLYFCEIECSNTCINLNMFIRVNAKWLAVYVYYILSPKV